MCDDHLFTIALLVEMIAGFRRPLWVAAVDLRKAFDSISYDSLWTAMLEQGAPKRDINLLQTLMRSNMPKHKLTA